MTTKEIFVFTPSTSKHAEQKALWKMFFNFTVQRHTELKEYKQSIRKMWNRHSDLQL